MVVRVDGPYGHATPVSTHDDLLFVAGGIGVTPCASIMKGVVGYRWKKGFIPNNLHFFWVARLSDLTTFKWLLVMLPELKAQQLVHNEYYGGDENIFGPQKLRWFGFMAAGDLMVSLGQWSMQRPGACAAPAK